MRKYLGFFIFCIAATLGIGNASAKNITLQEIANKFNEMAVQVNYGNCNGVVTAVAEDVFLSIKCNSSEIFNLNYASNVLSYVKPPSSESTIHGDVNAIYTIIDSVVESILLESGYEKMSLASSILETDFTIVSTPAVTTQSIPVYRAGMVFSELLVIDRLQISLDTDKIANIVAKYGDPYIRKILEDKPKVSAKSITSSSLKLYPTVESTPDDKNYSAKCYVYRSTELNGDYKIISTPDNCLTGAIITDTGLEADTNYYYKIQMVGSRIQSDAISVATLENGTDPEPDPTPDPETDPTPDTPNPGTDPDKQNPDTGNFIPVVVLGLFTIGSVYTLVYTNKKNKFKNNKY